MVRLATINDIEDIMSIYVIAQQYMMDTGNTSQWPKGYPTREMIIEDIAAIRCHVIVDQTDEIHGVFYFCIEDDITYKKIYDGNWHSDESYGVIHRIASDGKTRGIVAEAVSYANQRISYLRIDTHENNKTMQHVLTKLGFERCGIIHLLNGQDRVAFDKGSF